ncbi:hypothetical protein EVAR_100393_1 [Eumeta japonica]|uniref:Uncharacterized protein n=1 Tax=Eumeta variegata TaxID=151549 RepID=A0A4C2AD15_EUMVA|nr:hypothetical protein EVAR_100393_1 [Eumeta japonica]
MISGPSSQLIVIGASLNHPDVAMVSNSSIADHDGTRDVSDLHGLKQPPEELVHAGGAETLVASSDAA